MLSDLRYKCRCSQGFTGVHCDVGKCRMFGVSYTTVVSEKRRVYERRYKGCTFPVFNLEEGVEGTFCFI